MKIISLLFLFSSIFTLEYEFIKYEVENKIGIIKISSSDHHNSLTNKMLDELDSVIERVECSKVSALIIIGEGQKAFVTGISIPEMYEMTKKEAEEFSKKGNNLFKKIENYPIPIIAAINGLAEREGFELALSCDIRICSDNAAFELTQTELGIIPGFGGTQRLARLVGLSLAKEIIFTNKRISSDEALKMRLVNGVYSSFDLYNEAKKIALAIAKVGIYTIKDVKKAINEGIKLDIDKAIQMEPPLFGECFETPEQKEAMGKILSKSTNVKVPFNLEDYLPKGELKLSNIFNSQMKLLTKDITIPAMPSILSAGSKESYNSMTIGWGTIGVGFGRPIFTVYVKPERYTHQIIDKSKYFTVSYIDKRLYSKFEVYGSKSGKDINKEEVSGTHIKFLDNGGITFEEAVEVFVCKIVAVSHLETKDVHQDILDMYNSNLPVYFSTNPHTVYTGEIIGHYLRE